MSLSMSRHAARQRHAMQQALHYTQARSKSTATVLDAAKVTPGGPLRSWRDAAMPQLSISESNGNPKNKLGDEILVSTSVCSVA